MHGKLRVLRELARRALEDFPECLGIASLVEPDLVRHWRRVVRRGSPLPRVSAGRVVILSTLARKRTWPGRAMVIAEALRVRGAEPIVIACDRWLEACEEGTIEGFTPGEFAEHGPRRIVCDVCFGAADPLYAATGLPYRRLSEFDAPGSRERARAFVAGLDRDALYGLCYRDIDLGPSIETSMFRFFRTTTRPTWDEPRSEDIARRFATSAVHFVDSLETMLAELRPDAIVVHYGAYVSRGIPPLVATAHSVRAVTVFIGHRFGTCVIGLGTHFFGELAARTSGPWSKLRLTSEQDERLDALLRDRQLDRSTDLARRKRTQVTDAHKIAIDLDIDLARPLLTLFTPVGWDTRQLYDAKGYHVEDCVRDAISIIAARPHVQLVIRCHPNEVEMMGERWSERVRHMFRPLPPNLRIVEAESPINSHALGRASAGVIVYGSTTGLEIACDGGAVVCAGRAPFRQKGFTYDVAGRADLEEHIDRLIEGSLEPGDRQERARAFAYYYWFMRSLPFPFWWRPEEAAPRARPWWQSLRSRDDLRPGRHKGLDAMCEAILSGQEPYVADA